MKEEIDFELLLKYFAGECSAKEENAVRIWLAGSSENREVFATLEKIWDTPERRLPAPDLDKAWASVAQKAGITDQPLRRNVADTAPCVPPAWRRIFAGRSGGAKLLRIAAMIALVALLPFFGSRFFTTSTPEASGVVLKEILVGKGKMETFVLVDGTRVTLDSGSRFRYPASFTGNVRGVELEGEGYFEVTPDAHHPFEVRAAEALIRVLGTRFDVMAWPENRSVQVAVLEGTVSLGCEGKDREKTVVIGTGQLSILDGAGNLSQPVDADIERELGWVRREVYFEGTPLSQILSRLGNWYNINFVLPDSSSIDERLTIHVMNEPLENTLKLITLLTDLQYELKADTVFFSVKRTIPQ